MATQIRGSTQAQAITVTLDRLQLADTAGKLIVADAATKAPQYVAMSGEATIVASGAVTLSNSAVIGKVLTSFTSGAGTVSASDSILGAIQKLDGNNALRVLKAGDTMTGSLTMSGAGVQLIGVTGTAGAPSFSFAGRLNTGVYSSAADKVAISTAGSQRVEISNTLLYTNIRIQLAQSGDATSPALQNSNANSGIFFATNDVGVSSGGAEIARFNSTGLQLTNNKALTFTETTGNGSNFIRLIAPTSLAGDTTYTLPAAYGTDGQVLSATAAGVMSWTTITASDRVLKAGDTMTGNLTMTTGTDVILPDAPVNATDAANKQYVDNTATAYATITSVPTGAIDGSNRVFTIGTTPLNGTEIVFLNGQRLNAGSGNDYTISGAVITLESSFPAPVAGDIILVSHQSASGGSTQTPAKAAIPITIDGGGSAITTGIKGDVIIPFACTINSVTLLADQSGSIVVDIWKDTYANYAPTVADTITASAKPTLASAIKSQDTTLTGWTKTLAAGDILRFNVDSASTVTRVLLSLDVTKN